MLSRLLCRLLGHIPILRSLDASARFRVCLRCGQVLAVEALPRQRVTSLPGR